jgi:hypothetical protein
MQFLGGKLTRYAGDLKLLKYVVSVCKAADKIRNTMFLKSFRIKKINELLAVNKLTNNSA